MYQEFYQLDTLPFENTPDPRFFYASEQHREAMAAIEYTLQMRKGFVLITGDIGSGKTTVGRTVCHRCGDSATIIHVLHGHQRGSSLIRQVLRLLGVAARRSDDHAQLLERLRDHLLERMQQGQPVVLLIDEAQTLSDAALEELRMLSNFDTSTRKPIQVVLIGQPELRSRICSPRFEALRQRIVLSKQLRPLNIAETTGYIQHRLQEASRDKQNVQVSFTEAAVREIHEFTHGVPRLVNVACDNCLLLGYVREAREIDPAMVRRVKTDMMPSFSSSTSATEAQPGLRIAGIA